MAVSSIGIASGNSPNRRLVARRGLLPPMVAADFNFQQSVLLCDLSETGLGAQAVVGPVPGTTTDCSFDLPDLGRIQAAGTVTWSDKTGRFGLHFDKIEDGDRGRLSEWLTRQRPAEREPTAVSAAPVIRVPEVRDPDNDLRTLRQQLISGRLSGDAAMQVLVDSLRAITGATGAAIAVESNHAIVCRASSGAAPPVGATVDRNSGLSGECVRTAEIVRCGDTEADPRVDPEVCRRLELRSAVIVPVFREGNVAGLVEVFSCRPHAFQNNAVRLLNKSAQVINIIAWPGTASAAAEALNEPSVPAAPIIPSPGPVAPRKNADFKATAVIAAPVTTPPAVEQKPAPLVTAPPPAAPKVVEPAAVAAATLPPEAPPKDHADAVLAELRARKLAQLTAAQIAADKSAAAQPHAAAVPLPDLLCDLEPEPRGFPWRLAILVALALAVAIAVWQLWPKAAAPTSRSGVESSQSVAAQPPQAAAALPTTSTSVALAAPRSAAPRSNAPANRTTPENVSDNAEEEVTVTPAPVARAAAPAASADAPPPTLPATGQQNNPVSSLLATRAAAPTLATNFPRSTGVTGGRLKTKVNPTYPPAAHALNISGTVVLNATVDRSGKVIRVTTVSGPPLLAAAAEAAVRRWVYEPFRLDGEPIQNDTRITVQFQPR